MAASSARKRARAAKNTQPPPQKADFGPILSRVSVETVADPSNPLMTIRRAAVVPPYVAWWKRGGIDDAERAAAAEYADLWGSSRASAPTADYSGGVRYSVPQGRDHYSAARVDAATKLERANVVIGEDGARLLVGYLCHEWPLRALSKVRRERVSDTPVAIRVALGLLVRHWGMYL